MSKRFDLVMFDLDGTLVATAPEIHDAVNDTLLRFDLPRVEQDQVEAWIGHGTQTLLLQALAFAGKTTAAAIRSDESMILAAAEFDRHYERRCGTRSLLYPHVREVLAGLRAQGVKLALVTNKELQYTRLVLDAHELAPMLDHVVGGDSLPSKKPDPAGLRSCLEHFGVEAGRALFVGDSSIDVATARNAAVAVWAVPYGYNMGQAIARAEPDRIIDNLRALLNQPSV